MMVGVITFPQGTTTPFKPIRRGTAHIIKTYKPIVVPIVIDGFRRSFDKRHFHKEARDFTIDGNQTTTQD